MEVRVLSAAFGVLWQPLLKPSARDEGQGLGTHAEAFIVEAGDLSAFGAVVARVFKTLGPTAVPLPGIVFAADGAGSPASRV